MEATLRQDPVTESEVAEMIRSATLEVFSTMLGIEVDAGEAHSGQTAGRPQAGVRPEEHVLERILGILAGREHLAGVREQPGAITVVDRAEGLIVACPEQRDELLVGAKAKERRPDARPWGC